MRREVGAEGPEGTVMGALGETQVQVCSRGTRARQRRRASEVGAREGRILQRE